MEDPTPIETPPNVESATAPAVDGSSLAPRWRRIAASLIDGVPLGLLGAGLGLVYFDELASLGVWARVLGLAIAGAYFGVLDSRIGDGRTLGKRVCGIRVIDVHGRLLSPLRAFTRFAILAVPWFFNGLLLLVGGWWELLAPLPVFAVIGVGGALVYLFLFNRRSRQSLHDLLTSSIVVRDGREFVPAPAIGRAHLAVVGLWLAACLAVPPLSARLLLGDFSLPPYFAETQRAIAAEVGNTQVRLFDGTRFFGDGRRELVLRVVVQDTSPHGAAAGQTAERVADIVLRTFPRADERNTLSIGVLRGYDILIGGVWHEQTFVFPPLEWRRRLRTAETRPGM